LDVEFKRSKVKDQGHNERTTMVRKHFRNFESDAFKYNNTIQYSFNGINDKYALFKGYDMSVYVSNCFFIKHTYNEVVNV